MDMLHLVCVNYIKINQLTATDYAPQEACAHTHAHTRVHTRARAPHTAHAHTSHITHARTHTHTAHTHTHHTRAHTTHAPTPHTHTHTRTHTAHTPHTHRTLMKGGDSCVAQPVPIPMTSSHTPGSQACPGYPPLTLWEVQTSTALLGRCKGHRSRTRFKAAVPIFT